MPAEGGNWLPDKRCGRPCGTAREIGWARRRCHQDPTHGQPMTPGGPAACIRRGFSLAMSRGASHCPSVPFLAMELSAPGT